MFPPWVIFSYIATSLAFVSALDFSKVNLTARMMNSDKHFRTSLWPFAMIETIIGKISGSSRSRSALATGYLLFDLTIMIGIPLAIAGILGGLLSSQDMIFIAIIVFLVPLEEFHRGLERIGDNNA
jgi:hypothetical protein